MATDTRSVDPRLLVAARRWATSIGAPPDAPLSVTASRELSGGTQLERPRVFGVSVRWPDGSASTQLVLKSTWHGGLAALRAIATLNPRPPALPLLIAGDDAAEDPNGRPPEHPLRPAWIVTPYYAGGQVGAGALPHDVFDGLACLHAHYAGRTDELRGIVRITKHWLRDFCGKHGLGPHHPPGSAAPHTLQAELEDWLRELAQDPRPARAVELLPQTLLHGDMHFGNVIVSAEHAVVIDWANARIGPRLLDIANVAELGSPEFELYQAAFDRYAGVAHDPRATELEYHYAKLQISTQYLGAALDFGGEEAALRMRDTARQALARLGESLGSR